MSGHEDDLIQLDVWAKEFDGRILDYLDKHPSPRINTHRPLQLIAAIQRELSAVAINEQREAERERWREQHEAELEAKRQAREEERNQRRVERPVEGTVTDPFIIQSAERLGVTPERFLELQDEARKRMEAGTRDVAAALKEVKP